MVRSLADRTFQLSLRPALEDRRRAELRREDGALLLELLPVRVPLPVLAEHVLDVLQPDLEPPMVALTCSFPCSSNLGVKRHFLSFSFGQLVS